MNDKKTKEHADTFVIHPLSVKELADIYQVSNVTFKKWLLPIKEKLGKREGWFYSIEQVKMIVTHLGFPEKVKR
jgi:transposase-like protein